MNIINCMPSKILNKKYEVYNQTFNGERKIIYPNNKKKTKIIRNLKLIIQLNKMN